MPTRQQKINQARGNRNQRGSLKIDGIGFTVAEIDTLEMYFDLYSKSGSVQELLPLRGNMETIFNKYKSF